VTDIQQMASHTTCASKYTVFSRPY